MRIVAEAQEYCHGESGQWEDDSPRQKRVICSSHHKQNSFLTDFKTAPGAQDPESELIMVMQTRSRHDSQSSTIDSTNVLLERLSKKVFKSVFW